MSGPDTFHMWAASQAIQDAGYWSVSPPAGGGNPSTRLVTITPTAQLEAAVRLALEEAQDAAQSWAPSESLADSELSETGRLRRDMWRKQDAAIGALNTPENRAAIIKRAGEK
jgi:hypothetical protein